MALYALCGSKKTVIIEPYKSHKFTKEEISNLICPYMPYVVLKKTVIIESNKSQKPTKEKISNLICPYMPYVVAKTRNIEPY